MVEIPYPLEGIRVVAFEIAAAGPFSTQILADMGAEVIKIERPHVGDTIRQWDHCGQGAVIRLCMAQPQQAQHLPRLEA